MGDRRIASGRKSTEWVGGMLSLPSYITGEGDAPYRPETLVWADNSGFVLGTDVFRPGEAAERIGESFRKTTRAPAVGAPHVPERMRVASAELAEILRRELAPRTEVVCAPTPEIDEVFASLLAHLTGEPVGPGTYLTAGVRAGGHWAPLRRGRASLPGAALASRPVRHDAPVGHDPRARHR
jgi:hypothetical protein